VPTDTIERAFAAMMLLDLLTRSRSMGIIDPNTDRYQYEASNPPEVLL
jgi:hypothetical protein